MRSEVHRLRAEPVATLLSELVDGEPVSDERLARQLQRDLRFQAELVQYRKLVRSLHALGDEVLPPPDGLVDDILRVLDEGGRPARRVIITGRRAAYLGGLAAATAAGVGTALVLARRRAA